MDSPGGAADHLPQNPPELAQKEWKDMKTVENKEATNAQRKGEEGRRGIGEESLSEREIEKEKKD